MSAEGRTLYIIDALAQLFRAYHAIRTPMTSPVTREPTNATFGFVGMLLKTLRECRPDYLAVAMDVSGDRGTFRSELYPEYKANRPEPPEALPPQIARCLDTLRAVGVPTIGAEGFEADDVMATLVARLREREPGLRIRLVSKDKDLQQLLAQGRVDIYDVHTDESLDEARLRAEKGVSPGQVVDMLALSGDAVDNVPGVEGVGPKTAAELIARFGSIDNLLAHAGVIPGKRGERLRAAAGALPLSRRLVTLRTDVPVDLDLEAADVSRLRLEALEPILRELGFHRAREELRALLEARGGGLGGAEPAGGRAQAGADRAPARARGLFEETLFDAAPEPRASPEREPGRFDYRCVRTRADLEALLAELRGAEIFAIDTETTSLSPLSCALCGVSVSARPFSGWYVPVRSPDRGSHLDERTVLEALRPLLEDPARAKCGHNLKYDLLVLRSCGVELRGGSFDSMIASYLVDASRSSHALDALALALLGHTTIPITDLIGSGRTQRTFDAAPLEAAARYAAEDADVSLRLRYELLPQLRAMGLEKLSAEVETPLLEVLAEMEWNGALVDAAELDRQAARLRERAERLRREIIDAAPRPFNPDSPKQLAGVLFNKPDDPESPGLGITPLKRTKTGASTDIEVLERLASDPGVATPVPRLIVEYRQLTKLVSTYLVALKEAINPRTGRVHASFHQTVAATGRLSSSDPNLQNIPIRTEIGREIRRAFVAPPGHVLLSADYSQIELRLLAHLSRDPALIEAFHAGADIHRAVAAQIHGVAPEAVTREQRDGAKMVNFGIVYGITAFGLARRLGVDEKAAARIIDDYKRRFAGITTFLQECVQQAQRFGYVETFLGRRRPIPQVHSRNPSERALGERMAINSVVQGSAADLIKLAMLDLHARLSPHAAHRRPAEIGGPGAPPQIEGVRMLLQIHDELVFEAPLDRADDARALIVDRMERAMPGLLVPMKVEASTGVNWHED